MAFSFSRPRSGSLSTGSVRGSSSGSDSWFSLSRLHAALPAARASAETATILLGPGRQQEALQGLNERLAGYLQRVRGLEAANRALEEEIAAIRARRAGAGGQKDWEACERPLAELRKQACRPFFSLLPKVRNLEQQNKVLETQLKLLKGKDQYKSNVGRIMAAHSQPLKQQIDALTQDKLKLQNELQQTQALLEELKSRYEDEINRRNQLENEFVVTKKDLDDIYLQKADVESKLESVCNEIKYLKQLFEEEIRELQSQIQNTMVTLEMDNNRGLEMKHIIDEVKEQYQVMAAKSRDEAEQWYKNKFDDMARQTQKHCEELKGVKGQIAELTRYGQRVNGEIEALKNQRANLENAVALAEEQGEQAVQSAKSSIQDLEDALRQAKRDMADKVRKYQELMHIKLALDMEIATYRKLLEGEENRLVGQVPSSQFSAIDKLAGLLTQEMPSPSHDGSTRTSFTSHSSLKRPLLIKTIETKDGKILSEASHFSEKQL
ncbi:keratin, type II cytoskeletal 8-like [Varanus komodoensis]|uniref:keratin, type II cytoskeletal 8-like n=1 Tax=Varanus komodoensis TaxID=61221 RepID=UPI001CF7873F|nr:keratin, type II cytoskeletal 8-like [Varanus komodoensis]